MECDASEKSSRNIEYIESLNNDLTSAINNLTSIIIQVNQNYCPRTEQIQSKQKNINPDKNNNIWN